MLHSPDGGEVWVESAAISVVQPATRHQDHVAAGTRTIIYTPAKNFGVREIERDILHMMKSCGSL